MSTATDVELPNSAL